MITDFNLIMFFRSFSELCPQIALEETRTFTILKEGELPSGTYILAESYCNQPDCDCRRVMLTVYREETGEIEAVVAYGWESREFYRRWTSWEPDEREVSCLKGPMLNPMSQQSPLAPVILKFIAEVILADFDYVERLKRHYRIFKQNLAPEEILWRKSRRRKKRLKQSKGFQIKKSEDN
jgi:hypothetical protein